MKFHFSAGLVWLLDGDSTPRTRAKFFFGRTRVACLRARHERIKVRREVHNADENRQDPKRRENDLRFLKLTFPRGRAREDPRCPESPQTATRARPEPGNASPDVRVTLFPCGSSCSGGASQPSGAQRECATRPPGSKGLTTRQNHWRARSQELAKFGTTRCGDPKTETL